MSVKDLFDLSSKVALVTGGSRGLGLEMATGLGEAGARLVITARREQWLTAAEQELRTKGIDCLAVACDVADPAQASASVSAAVGRFGRLDILINNAGISWGGPIETMTVEKWRQGFGTNATGCLLIVQAGGSEMQGGRRAGFLISIT